MKKYPEYLYHTTSIRNFITILKEKRLCPKGGRINGYDEETISFSDILSDYTAFYGDCIIEFIAESLCKKNNIYPYKYEVDENSKDFYDMPFWEAEWRTKEVSFDYNDINQIYFLTPPLLTLSEFLKEKNIKYKQIEERDLPSFPEEFFIKRYKERLKGRKHAQV